MPFLTIFAGIEAMPLVLTVLSAGGIVAVPRFAIWAARAVALFITARRSRE